MITLRSSVIAWMAMASACGTPSRPSPAPTHVRPPPVTPTQVPTQPAEPGRSGPMVSGYPYLRAIDGTTAARIIKAVELPDGSSEVLLEIGARRRVDPTWSAVILAGDTEHPLAGGELTITKIEERFTRARTSLSRAQLERNPRVRLSAPASPPAPAGGPKAPHAIAHVEIRYSYTSKHCGNARTYALDWDGTAYRTDTGRSIDAPLVTALSESLVGLVASDAAATCYDHTDDYPKFELAFGDDLSTPAVVLSSTSTCQRDNAPWNVVRGGRRFVQHTGGIGDAVYALLAAVDPERWAKQDRPMGLGPWYQECEER